MGITGGKIVEDKYISFGLAIKNARMDCGLTQEQLSERAGITCRYLIAIENEGKIPKYSVMYRLIHALHISADRIFYFEQSNENSELSQLISMLKYCSERDVHILLCTIKAMLNFQ